MEGNSMKSPAFQFYVQDFLHGTMTFSAEEIGAYILMLCRQWDKGYVEEHDLEEVTKLSRKKIEKVLKKFSKKKSRYTNKRMALVRKERDEYSKKQARSGFKGAIKRWHLPSKKNGTPIISPMAKNGSSSSSSSSTTATAVEQQALGMEVVKKIANECWKDQSWRHSFCQALTIQEPELKKWMAQFNISVSNDSLTDFSSSKYKKIFRGFVNREREKGITVMQDAKEQASLPKRLQNINQ